MWVMSMEESPAIVEKAKAGEVHLSCLFEDGWRAVPADKVVGLEGSRWLFTNGSAGSCNTTQKGE